VAVRSSAAPLSNSVRLDISILGDIHSPPPRMGGVRTAPYTPPPPPRAFLLLSRLPAGTMLRQFFLSKCCRLFTPLFHRSVPNTHIVITFSFLSFRLATSLFGYQPYRLP
jgi:hypothetical protein